MPRQHSWIKKLFHRAPRTRGRRSRLTVEALEDRTVPSAGDLDPTFGTSGQVLTPFDFTADIAEAVAVQADGKIVSVGSSFSSATGDDFALARYNADGSLDTSFSGDGLLTTDFAGSGDIATSVAIQADGKIVVAGYSGQIGTGRSDFALARYNADGSLDSSFSGEGRLTTDFGSWDDVANSVAIQADGKIVVAGWSIDGSMDFALARYNADGSLDTFFSGDGRLTTDFGASTDVAVSVSIQADGKIVAAGTSLQSATEVDFALARYNADGSLDTSFSSDGRLTTDFGTAGDDFANSVAIQADGKIVVAGESSPSGIWNDFALARYNVDGSLDSSFSGDGRLTTNFGSGDAAISVAIQADGKIVAAGWSIQSGTSGDFALARYYADGSLDTSFSSDGWLTTHFGGANEIACSVAIQSDGKIVAVGVSDALGRNTFALARYLNSQPPTSHAGGPYAIYVGDSLTLDASLSSDPDGDRLTYSWDVNGDGVFGDAADMNPTLTWDQLRARGIDAHATPFNVQVRVDDGQSQPVDSSATTLTVTATTPGYTPAVGLQSGNTNVNTTFNLGSFVDVLAAGPWTVQVAWGDGATDSFEATNPGALSRAHAYATAGLFSVTVTVTNNYGNSAAGTVQIVAGTYVINTLDSGAGSLRQALLYSNASVGVVDTISFAIGSGVQTITPLSRLPIITDPVIIDGTTQPGFAGKPIIELNGTSAGSGAFGLGITAGASTIRGLVINRYSGAGIIISSSAAIGNVVAGNYIGTDVTGTLDFGNAQDGVRIQSGAKNNTIGGNTASARNVISGNNSDGIEITGSGTSGNVVAGNYIGTRANGSSVLGNIASGVFITNAAGGNVIGGATESTRNIISGNNATGIYGQAGIAIADAAASGTVIQGNFIGLDSTGTVDLGNGEGVFTRGANTTIGGLTAIPGTGTGNVISGNGSGPTWLGNVHVLGSGAAGTQVLGNLIGTNATGGAALDNTNSQYGAYLESTQSITIGGNTPMARNVISGHANSGVPLNNNSGGTVFNNRIIGNYIGTNIEGIIAIGNLDGITVANGATGNRIGGSSPDERNIISGNRQNGILIAGVGAIDNVVAGNYIGTNASGSSPLANGGAGVLIRSGAASNIIGTNGDGFGDAREGNLISGNAVRGVQIEGVGTNGNRIAGNLIGSDALGTTAIGGNGPTAVLIRDGAKSNIVGTNGDGLSDADERNIISGNTANAVAISGNGTENNRVAGNYIGVDRTGDTAMPNTGWGVILAGAKENTVGTNGDGVGDADERNVIGANTLGVGIGNNTAGGPGTDNNVVAGNYIGLNAAGTAAIPNRFYGIQLAFGVKNNRIGSNADGVGDTLERNVISGNAWSGVGVFSLGTEGNVVAGNFIGLNAAGTEAIPNVEFGGVYLAEAANRNRIGTNADGIRDDVERNVISGNAQDGVRIEGAGTSANIVAGNYIGTDPSGTLNLGNALDGVKIFAGASGNIIGGPAATAANTIAFNAGAGILIQDDGTVGNQIRGNSIHSNGSLGIELAGDGVTLNDAGDGDAGPNNRINFPVITSATNGSATLVSGTFDSAGTGPFTVEFFASAAPDGSGYGEGQRFLGATTLATAGDFNATLSGTNIGEWITATVTDAQGNTSEFSLALLTNNPPIASAGGPYAINEGDGLSLDASATTDLDGDSLLYSWDINGDGIFGDATGINPTLTWGELVALGINDGTRNFGPRVRVDDQHGGVTTSSAAAITLANTAPVAGLTVPTQAVRQQSRSFTLTAIDPSPADQAASFTFQIDWDGNGVVDETRVGPSGHVVTHIFPLARTYTIIVTASDKDGGTSAPVSQTLTVAVAQMQEDDLVIGGTITSDRFALTLGAANGVIAVLNGRNLGTFTVPGNINLFAAGGIDLLTLNGSPVADAFDVAATTVTRGSRVIMGSSIESRVLNGKGGDDTFTMTSALPATAGLAVNGNSGTDTLVAPASGDHFWLINDPNAGTLDNRAFNGIESLVGGEAADSFVFQEDGSVGGVVDGGGGTDLVDYSSAETRIIINLSTGTASKTGGISGIEMCFGGTGNRDRLTGPAGPNTWRITEADCGTVNDSLEYYGFEDLFGGAAADHFILTEEGSITGALAGNGGDDTLDFSERVSAVAVNLAAGTATATGGITGIVNVLGGAANDTLTGNDLNNLLAGGAGDDILNGGAGRDLLIGGSGADEVTGGTGTGEDLLIGGIVAYYLESLNALDLPALTAVMLEWTRTDLAAAARVEHLTGAVAGGFNGDYLLGPDTVFDDAVADRVEGGNGADWLLVSLTGLVPDNLINRQTADIVTDIV